MLAVLFGMYSCTAIFEFQVMSYRLHEPIDILFPVTCDELIKVFNGRVLSKDVIGALVSLKTNV